MLDRQNYVICTRFIIHLTNIIQILIFIYTFLIFIITQQFFEMNSLSTADVSQYASLPRSELHEVLQKNAFSPMYIIKKLLQFRTITPEFSRTKLTHTIKFQERSRTD